MEFFHNIKLKDKLTLLYIFAVFIPVVVTNWLFYYVTTQNLKQQRIHDASLVIEQIKNDWKQHIEQAMGISTLLYMDNQINEMLDRQYQSEAEYVQSYNEILPQFNKYRYMYPFIRSITFFTSNPTVMFSAQVQPLTVNIQQTEWYRQMSSLPNLIHVNGEFFIVRKLDYFTVYNETLKFVKIDLDRNVINYLFQNKTFPGSVYLVNSKGKIEYATNLPTSSDIQDTVAHFQVGNEKIIVEHKYGEGEYFKGWKVIGLIDSEKIYKEIHYSGAFVFYLTILNLLIPSLIIFSISRSLNARIKRLLKYIKKMENEQFETIRTDIYRDEIGQLTQAFNHMSYKIKRLIKDVYVVGIQKKELELKKKQAQLEALRNQINPHFLFNVLETIRMRSVVKKEYETAEMIENMANILRKSISWGRDWVTVREEIRIVMSFLNLQKYRFGDKISYDIQVDKELYEKTIPNMIILTFVENAFKHGMETKRENGKVNVQIIKEEEWMKICIRDNGPGIEEQTLMKLFESLNKEEEWGNIGIKNVYYRLKMLYGNRFIFQIFNDDGTVVKIFLPLELEE